ncbi:unnamed protein product [Adineta ricciae]|uniref:Uncharacterized protein n=1 Tax=Adineta ricciae TaxID=249248 RepID=A0A815D4J6_ADIRI|nr:unnamed protein product [Adineta ricciae]
MLKRFHSGHIVETKDDRVKNVKSRDGGGTHVIDSLDEYLNRYKFHGNNAVVYLCTRENTTPSIHSTVSETLPKITTAKDNDIILTELKGTMINH